MERAPSGKYKLKSHGIYKNGIFNPTSSFLKGEINYAADSSLYVLIIFKEQPEELNDLLSYSGTFRVISHSKLEHHISVSSHVSMTGTIETRDFSIAGDQLILEKMIDEQSRFQAVWVKA